MRKLILLTALCSFYTTSLWAQTCSHRGPNVIFFTWDGVRPRELYKGTSWTLDKKIPKDERGEIFQNFWSEHIQQGVLYGGGGRYKIASDIAISLPSYQAMMAGGATDCKNNGCDTIKVETLPERLQRELALPKQDVAVFASWNRIAAAAARDMSIITNGIHPTNFQDESAEFSELATRAQADLPHWNGSRKDQYTFEMSMTYLKKYCPRFLWISLVDSDEFGHEGKYPEYVRSLKDYDKYLTTLINTLKDLGQYGEDTTVFVTTDHGRGIGPLWREHAITPFTEKAVFLYASGPHVKKSGKVKTRANHSYLRPTIEAIMGLTPSSDKLLHEVLPPK